MVDALAAILDIAKRVGHIQGFILHLLPEGVSHPQYADDTIILTKNNDLGIANLRFLLIFF
jgi:hypothetical protein